MTNKQTGIRSVYIAASLDGRIATPEGGVDWLHAVEGEGVTATRRFIPQWMPS